MANLAVTHAVTHLNLLGVIGHRMVPCPAPGSLYVSRGRVASGMGRVMLMLMLMPSADEIRDAQ